MTKENNTQGKNAHRSTQIKEKALSNTKPLKDLRTCDKCLKSFNGDYGVFKNYKCLCEKCYNELTSKDYKSTISKTNKKKILRKLNKIYNKEVLN